MPHFLKAIILVCCIWPTLSCAADNYGTHPAALTVVDELVEQEGFDREALLQVFAQAQKKQGILDAMSRPAEKTKPWYAYRGIFLTDKREKDGVEFYNMHRKELERAEQETGVPAEIIVAIIGVETSYGRIMGSYRVLDALTTLAFDYPRRAEFFTRELKSYLLLTREQGFDPTELKGSYAGAMGYGQFMPSSYRAYAIDFDGDGVTDIWNNKTDAIGSVANYFVEHGWRAGEPVVFPAAASSDNLPLTTFVQGRSGLKPERSIAEFAELGVTTTAEVEPQALATAMKFELEDGFEYWLGMHNFYVITRYNHSAMYAMSVYQLSQRLAELIEG
jgi:membrane-bound lytic murein transglycosylase B